MDENDEDQSVDSSPVKLKTVDNEVDRETNDIHIESRQDTTVIVDIDIPPPPQSHPIPPPPQNLPPPPPSEITPIQETIDSNNPKLIGN